MDRRYQRFRGIQQTIPSMMQNRDEIHSINASISPMTSGVGNPGVYCQQQSAMNTPRMTPYKVPFQRRQLAEPLYADSAPVIIPQPLQLSSPYGLGPIFRGTTGLYMPTYQQNLNELPNIDNSNGMCFREEIIMKNEQDAYVTGLTSSPPNHPLPRDEPKVLNINTPILKAKEIIQNPISGKVESKPSSSKYNQNEIKKETQMSSPAAKQPFDPSKISLRVLTGSVEKVTKWEKMWENKMEKPTHLFEIIAPLLQLKAGSKVMEKQVLLREPGGPVLTVVYYEIDQMVPKLTVGEHVRCVCRSLGKRRYQAFTVRPATQKEKSSLERLSFLSHQAVQEALISAPEP
ncbi:uncharacterized protein [Hetaerina americana]|uniref:uncharacterized protein n=1 Tax=Hetaerina americana TaxID=62018 RepID=UPI003A7F4C29